MSETQSFSKRVRLSRVFAALCAVVGLFAQGGYAQAASPGALAVGLNIWIMPPPNQPPVISGTPAASVRAGQAYGFTPTASDPEGQTIGFAIVNKPVWATFDAATGRLSGTPVSTQVGTYSNIIITVSDGRASATLAPFSITVQPVSRSATVSWTPPTTYVDGSPITNLAGFRIFYGRSLIGFTQSVTIPSPAITSAMIEGLSSGTWYFAVKAYTTSNVESDFSQIRQKTFQ